MEYKRTDEEALIIAGAIPGARLRSDVLFIISNKDTTFEADKIIGKIKPTRVKHLVFKGYINQFNSLYQFLDRSGFNLNSIDLQFDDESHATNLYIPLTRNLNITTETEHPGLIDSLKGRSFDILDISFVNADKKKITDSVLYCEELILGLVPPDTLIGILNHLKPKRLSVSIKDKISVEQDQIISKLLVCDEARLRLFDSCTAILARRWKKLDIHYFGTPEEYVAFYKRIETLLLTDDDLEMLNLSDNEIEAPDSVWQLIIQKNIKTVGKTGMASKIAAARDDIKAAVCRDMTRPYLTIFGNDYLYIEEETKIGKTCRIEGKLAGIVVHEVKDRLDKIDEIISDCVVLPVGLLKYPLRSLQLPKIPLKIIQGLPVLSRLIKLETLISDDDIAYLSHFNLNHICLHGTITKYSELLKMLRMLPLQTVYMNGIKWTDSIAELIGICTEKKWKVLCLRGCGITTIEWIKKVTNDLLRLDIRDNAIPPVGPFVDYYEGQLLVDQFIPTERYKSVWEYRQKELGLDNEIF